MLKILNTRPGIRGTLLGNLLQQEDFQVFNFPVQIIKSIDLKLNEVIDLVEKKSHWVFVSPIAVDILFKQLKQLNFSKNKLDNVIFYAVGEGTKQALDNHIKDKTIIYPKNNHGAKALFETIQSFDLKNQSFFIFRGEAGSDLLCKLLKEAKACVKEIICYQRKLNPELESEVFNQFILNTKLDAIIFTSFEPLRLLYRDYANAISKKHALITVTNKEMESWALDKGFQNILFLEKIDNSSIVQSVNSHFKNLF